MMRLTGTFLDEISFDIPHHNWGPVEWDKDFRAMKAMGIKRVILIRCANKNFMTYDSKVVRHYSKDYVMHTPPIDLVDMFLTLAEKYEMEFYFGHVYFMGIGGISMSGLAEILLDQGFSISGSDMKESALTKQLEEKNPSKKS